MEQQYDSNNKPGLRGDGPAGTEVTSLSVLPVDARARRGLKRVVRHVGQNGWTNPSSTTPIKSRGCGPAVTPCSTVRAIGAHARRALSRRFEEALKQASRETVTQPARLRSRLASRARFVCLEPQEHEETEGRPFAPRFKANRRTLRIGVPPPIVLRAFPWCSRR